MKIFRVRYFTNGGCHGGYSFHALRRQAVSAQEEYQQINPDEQPPVIDVWCVEVSAAGVVGTLNLLASHADNG